MARFAFPSLKKQSGVMKQSLPLTVAGAAAALEKLKSLYRTTFPFHALSFISEDNQHEPN